jgi:hypothetical protein
MELPIDAKAIDDFPGYYVTPAGEVWSTRTSGPSLKVSMPKRLVPWRHKSKKQKLYWWVTLCRHGKPIKKSLHRLVAKVFLVRPEGVHLVRHLDDNPSNNHVNNLAWGTYSDNLRDALQNGARVLPPKQIGEKNNKTNLMPLDVLFIRERRRHGETYRSIAETYGISLNSAEGICARRSWRHLP